ncbi:DUF3107 domain-containing protein [Corynebacterium sp. sy039]|uniref:DUF3107 domain-containing protein n=1 Tax=Corynebacterium sp. sy039 TaxID=2599641 RepID=UPI0011B5B4E0|nr:DUF3107 domain-containing protein [Corynebacterium sp. sy039]QDZ42145.1 DUF3107 domain-containing protein [Corynebacterium sp. sy039]
MDIKIGLTQSPRELVISSTNTQEELAAQVSAAFTAENAQGSGVLDLVDERGNRYLVRTAQIAYVELGSNQTRTVGFAGA